MSENEKQRSEAEINGDGEWIHSPWKSKAGKLFPSQDSPTHPDVLEKNASGDWVRKAKE